MIHTKDAELDVVLLVLLLETFVSLRKWCAFCGNNNGGLGREVLWYGATAAAAGNRIMRANIIKWRS